MSEMTTEAAISENEKVFDAYLKYATELSAARASVLQAERQVAMFERAVRECVGVLGTDPLGALVVPAKQHRLPGAALREVLPLLPGTAGALAKTIGMHPSQLYQMLRKAEERGVVRREESGKITSFGKPVYVWHRVERQ